MAFELKYQTPAGTFHVQLNREVPTDEVMRIIQFGSDSLGMGLRVAPQTETARDSLGPIRIGNQTVRLDSPEAREAARRTVSLIGPANHPVTATNPTRRPQTLGENPVSHMDLGGYKEPTEGTLVRIKMMSLPDVDRIPTMRWLRSCTDLPLKACMQLIYGNHPGPVFSEQVARQIVDGFTTMGFVAILIGVPVVTEGADADLAATGPATTGPAATDRSVDPLISTNPLTDPAGMTMMMGVGDEG